MAEETDWDVRQTCDMSCSTRVDLLNLQRPKIGHSGRRMTPLSVGLSVREWISGTAKQNMQVVSETHPDLFIRGKAARALS